MTKTEVATKRIRVGIVDDHTMMREGIRLFVQSLPDFEFAWGAADANTAIAELEKDPPDVLIVDITLPGRSGLELIKDVKSILPDLPILVLSMHDEALYAQRALRAGARGYLMKSAPHDEVEQALRKVASGGMAVSQNLSEEILLAFSSGVAPKPIEGLHSLSDREFEVFQLIGEGNSTLQIADQLRISPKTVDVHKMKIRSKLRLDDGGSLTRYAIRWTEMRRLGSGQ